MISNSTFSYVFFEKNQSIPFQSESFSVCHIVFGQKNKNQNEDKRDSSEPKYKLELSSYTKIIEVFRSVLIDKDLIVFLK